jgi:hypothetical protein
MLPGYTSIFVVGGGVGSTMGSLLVFYSIKRYFKFENLPLQQGSSARSCMPFGILPLQQRSCMQFGIMPLPSRAAVCVRACVRACVRVLAFWYPATAFLRLQSAF